MNINYEKIIISEKDKSQEYQGQSLNEKHIIVESADFKTELGELENCIIEGGYILCKNTYNCKFLGTEKLLAEKLEFSVFENCTKIQVGNTDFSNKVSTSQFVNCGTISITDADVTDCIFNNFKMLDLTNTELKNCLIQNVICEDNCAIVMDDGEMSDVSFENIELRGDAYLIEAYGSPWVSDSVFMNIRTSRDDKELFLLEEETGLIFKKKKKFYFVDERSCSGLNFVADLDGNIDLSKFKNQ